MQPPHLYSEAGEGWYVVASDEASRQINGAIPNLNLQQFVHREVDGSGKPGGNGYSQTDPL